MKINNDLRAKQYGRLNNILFKIDGMIGHGQDLGMWMRKRRKVLYIAATFGYCLI